MRKPVETPASSAPDQTVIDQALAGDRQAWAELIRRHDRRLVVSLIARGLPFERARELAQETWLRLIEQQRRGRLRELRLPGLAIAQARYLHLSQMREPAAEIEPIDLDPCPTVEDRLLGREQLARAERALATCSPSARQAFGLVYENPGLPHSEVAARLGLSLQRVRQTLCEVRKRIRMAIEGDS